MGHRVQGLGLRVQNLGLRVQGLELRVQVLGSGFRVRVQDSAFGNSVRRPG